MSRIRSAPMLSTSISPLFDNLWISANDAYTRDPIGIPHCDCHTANERFYKKNIPRKNGDGAALTAAYDMVPTETKGDACAFCGFYFKLLPQQTARKPKTKTARFKAQKVVGTEVKSGRKLYFDSMKQATLAGHGRVEFCVKQGKPNKRGWLWEVVDA